jgi:hypothetical protein
VEGSRNRIPVQTERALGAVIYSIPLTSRSFVNIHGRATPDTSKSARAIVEGKTKSGDFTALTHSRSNTTELMDGRGRLTMASVTDLP